MNTLSTINLTGRVTADLELRKSKNGNDTKYLQFDLAVSKGYGDKEHTNFYQCIMFGRDAERMISAKVGKGSLIQLTGDLDLVEFTRKDGTKGMQPKITVYSWTYAQTSKSKSDDSGAENAHADNTANSSSPPQSDDGVEYEQIPCEDGLPF